MQNPLLHESTLDSSLFHTSPTGLWDPSLGTPLQDPPFFNEALASVINLGSLDATTTPFPETISATLALDHNLAKLSHNLSGLYAKVPPISIWSSIGEKSSDELYFQPDDLLALTQRMVDLYRDVASIQTSEAQALSNPTVYMLISCHYRLLDIWELVFTHMGNCVGYAENVGPVQVPTFSVGSFKTSPSTSVTLYVTLMTQFAQQLQDGVLAVVAKLVKDTPPMTRPDAANGSFEDLMKPSDLERPPNPTLLGCQVVADRAAKMVTDVEAITTSIPEFMFQH